MKKLLAVWLLMFSLSTVVWATQTENNGIRILPASGPVVVDGKANDWDLSGGIFICDSVETQRDQYAVWLHVMHDAKNLYVLARFLDQTPLNNPGQTIADYGFAGDSLQMRFITAPGAPNERTAHLTAWQGRDGRDVMDIAYGKKFDEGGLKDAKAQGAQQAFQKDVGKGYTQEIALPWKLLTKDGQPPRAGERMALTVEPNFTVVANGRMTIKDIFKPGITPDRVFTFMSSPSWGPATLEAKGQVAPQPVRLSDAREFPVNLQNGIPVVDWTGLIKSKEMPGFKSIGFTMPQDGYISLHIKNAQGQVVRQLLNAAFYAKGAHEVKWDGLTTPNWNVPGQPVPPGDYVWSALSHAGIGLKLRGWAANGGAAPWDSGPGTNWGGDHGVPSAVATDDKQVYLGWSGAEAGKAVVACDLQGKVLWNNNRAGISGVKALASDSGVVYVLGGASGPAAEGGALYKLDAKTGAYLPWDKSGEADLIVKNLWPDKPNAAGKADAIASSHNTLFLSYAHKNAIQVLEASNGQALRTISVPAPGAIADGTVNYHGPIGGRLPVLIYVLSGGTKVLALNPWGGEPKTIVDGLANATSLAVGKDGKIYVGGREPDNQVKVFDAEGKPVSAIGRKGGRALLGAWTPDGMAFIQSLSLDADGKLWVAEADGFPKRVSAWDAATGKLVKEFFGPSSYGALGGAINPLDPNLMVGQGCEWRLDPQTGKAICLGVITRDGMENSRFGMGANGKLYLAVASKWAFEAGPVNIFERVGDADYKLRAGFSYEGKDNTKTLYWADENGDGKPQPNEVTTVPGALRVSGWYMAMAPDLTLSAGDNLLKVTGFTATGAPKYDLANPIKMPATGMTSADDKLVLHGGDYGVDHSWFTAMDIASGKVAWTYPDTFVGVHGSHNAPPPETGLIRGSYGVTGVAQLPAPIGNIWMIPTNVGEWHVLTGDGFYLTRLFQPDPLKIKFPEQAVPGADMSDTPPGMGGEDFGGSVTLGKDGKLYLQAGKTAFWNLEVTGLDNVKALKGAGLNINDAEVKIAQSFHDQLLQAAVGKRQTTVKRMTPAFTGNLDNDFKGADIISYKKSDDAAARSAAAWDDANLYLAWDVKDNTPWQNGATDAAQMYIGGDTVDFQLGTDPNADKNRSEAAQGDLRLSIGNLGGKDTAVLYRKTAKLKKPKVFSSGVVKAYAMDFVDVLADAKIIVTKRGDGYTVEAAIPFAALDFKPLDGLNLRGDFGVTHGDPAGGRTRLRTYWNNQHTGIVDDAVFELMLEPKNWGELTFR